MKKRIGINKKFFLRMMSLLLTMAMLFNIQEIGIYATVIGQEAESDIEEPIVKNVESLEAETVADNNMEYADSISDNGLIMVDDTVATAGTPANPVHHCTKLDDGSDYTDWSYVYFGTYPQSEVTDAATIADIDNAIASAGKTSDGEGIDVWVGSAKYRRISKSDCKNDGHFDEVDNNGCRYFKWERIKWRVLNNNGSTLFVMADKGIDCKCYHDTYTDVTWETSDIRSWLNGTFYQNAFSTGEQGAVVAQTVENADNPDYGTEGGNSTTDKVFLLSLEEIKNESYGFCSDYRTYSASRWRQPSAYARARGSSTYNSTYTGDNDNCWWWLRSPGWYSSDASDVLAGEYVNSIGTYVNNSYGTFVPALHINLSSDLWSLTDDGTSGSGGTGGSDEEESGNVTYDELTLTEAVYEYGSKKADLLKEVYSVESGHGAFTLKCKAKGDISGSKTSYAYSLYSGEKKIGKTTKGEFLDVKPSDFTAGDKIYVRVSDGVHYQKTQIKLNIKADKVPVIDSLQLGGDGIDFTLGDDVPLLGGSEMKFSLPELPVSAIIEDGKIKIGVNIKEKSLYSSNSIEGNTTTSKNKSMKDKFEEWKNDALKTKYLLQDKDIVKCMQHNNFAGRIPGISKDVDLKVIGYFEADWSDSLEKVEGSLIVQLSGKAKLEKQVMVWVIPVTLQCTFKAEGELGAKASYDFISKSFGGELTAGLTIAVEPYAGVGVSTWASVGIYGEVSLGIEAVLLSTSASPGLDEVNMYGELGLTAYLAKSQLGKLPVVSMKDLKKTSMSSCIDEDNHLLIYSRTQNSLIKKQTGKAAERNMASCDNLYASLGSGDFGMSWAEDTKAVNYSTVTGGVLADNVYAAAQPQYIKTADTTMLLYVDNDTGRWLSNQTVASCRIFNGNTWSEPEKIHDDGTADFKVKYYVDGNDIYAYFQDSRKVFSGTEPELADYAGSFGIALCRYNAQTKAFEHMKDFSYQDCYAYAPALIKTENGLSMIWVENTENHVFGLNDSNHICISSYDETSGAWSAPAALATGLNSVTSLAAGALGGDMVLAYCEDADNDLLTPAQTLKITDLNGTILREESGDFTGLQYTPLPVTEDEVLAWNAAGDIAYLSQISGAVQKVFGADVLGTGTDYVSDGSAVYYLYGADDARNIQALLYQDGEWGSAQLTEETGYVDAFSADGRTIAYVLTQADVEDASADIETNSQIKLLTDYEKNDLILETADYSVYEAVPGEKADFEIYIRNEGTDAADAVTVVLKDSKGVLVDEAALDIVILPGEEISQTVSLKLPDEFNGNLCTLTVGQTAITDENSEDNALTVDLGRTELAVDTAYLIEDEKTVLDVLVTNYSYVDDTADIKLTDAEGNILAAESFDVAGQEVKEWKFEITEDLLNENIPEIVLTAEAAGSLDEYYQNNNTAAQRIMLFDEDEPTTGDSTADDILGSGESGTPGDESEKTEDNDNKELETGIEITTPEIEYCTVQYMDDTWIPAKKIKEIKVPKGQTIASTKEKEPVINKSGYRFDGWVWGISKWNYNNDIVNKDIVLTPILTYIPKVGDKVSADGYGDRGYYKILSTGADARVELVSYSVREGDGYLEIPDTARIGGKDYKITSIGKNCFIFDDTIECIVIQGNVTEIGNDAFNSCPNLKTVFIEGNVKTIGKNAFNGCKKLSRVTLGKNVVTVKDNAFRDCISLKKITIPKNVQTIGKKAFYGCKKLKTVYIKCKKIKKLGASAFKKIHSSATIHVNNKYETKVKKVCESTTRVVK